MTTEALKQIEVLEVENTKLRVLQKEVLDLSRFLFDIYRHSYKEENETIIAGAIKAIKKLRTEVFELKTKFQSK